MGILLILLGVLFIVLLFRHPHHWYWAHEHGHCHAHESSGATAVKTPLDILSERYARGEIDKADFDQRRADLQ